MLHKAVAQKKTDTGYPDLTWAIDSICFDTADEIGVIYQYRLSIFNQNELIGISTQYETIPYHMFRDNLCKTFDFF